MYKRKRLTGGSATRPIKKRKWVVAARSIPRGPPARLVSRVGELKSVDILSTTATLNTTGAFAALNIPVEGASFYNRVGRQIEMRSLHLVGSLFNSGNVGSNGNEYIRVMVLYDHQPNGAFPAVADVLTGYSSAGGTSSTVFDHLNMNNKDRFVVLADVRLLLANNSAAVSLDNRVASQIDYKGEYNVNRFIKLKGLVAHYKATAGAIGDLSTGALLLFTYGNIASGSEGYLLNYSARLRYMD